MNIYWIVDRIAYRFDIKRRLEHANSRCDNKCKRKLSWEEEKQFKTSWVRCKSISYEVYKAYGVVVNPQIVPNDYYDFAEHVLNLRWSAFFLQHKCNLKYIIPEQNRPKTILQKIDGHYVFEDNKEITEDEAKEILRQHETFICKVALGSGGGKGVHRISWETVNNQEEIFHQLMKPEDLIFQEVLVQSDFMSSLNPDSVNTFRLLTLNINNNCTVLSSFVRMGAKGSFVDNLSSGGGALVGINQHGEFSDFGIRKDYSKIYETPTGLLFKGMKVPNWDGIKKQVVGFHRRIPYANLIGWDIALDKDGEPIVIEINLDSAEIEAHQIFNGPVFGERLNEVRAYIERKRPLLRHAMITY